MRISQESQRLFFFFFFFFDPTPALILYFQVRSKLVQQKIHMSNNKALTIRQKWIFLTTTSQTWHVALMPSCQ